MRPPLVQLNFPFFEGVSKLDMKHEYYVYLHAVYDHISCLDANVYPENFAIYLMLIVLKLHKIRWKDVYGGKFCLYYYGTIYSCF